MPAELTLRTPVLCEQLDYGQIGYHSEKTSISGLLFRFTIDHEKFLQIFNEDGHAIEA